MKVQNSKIKIKNYNLTLKKVQGRILHFAFCIIFTLGCGYHFVGGGSALPVHIKKIGIPMASNRTSEPNLEDELTKALSEEFQKDGRLKVVSNEDADAILYSDIVSFQTVALSIQKDMVSAYRIVMKVDFRLEDRMGKNIIWEEKGMESGIKTDYKVTSGIDATRLAKDAAIKKNCKDLSQDVISRIFEGF